MVEHRANALDRQKPALCRRDHARCSIGGAAKTKTGISGRVLREDRLEGHGRRPWWSTPAGAERRNAAEILRAHTHGSRSCLWRLFHLDAKRKRQATASGLFGRMDGASDQAKPQKGSPIVDEGCWHWGPLQDRGSIRGADPDERRAVARTCPALGGGRLSCCQPRRARPRK